MATISLIINLSSLTIQNENANPTLSIAAIIILIIKDSAHILINIASRPIIIYSQPSKCNVLC